MEFQKLAEARRSVRKYADREVTREQVEEIIRTAQEAPSWKNQQTSKYYIVLSKEKREAVRTTCFPSFNEQRSLNAALVVTAFEKNNVGFNENGEPVNELGNGWGCYDLGLQNAYFILKARELGLDTLIMGIRDADKLRAALDIPENEEIGAVLALGYADEEPKKPRRRELDDIAKFY
ncbi:nitroreductase family protein [Ruminococcus sp.]|uniref:nitroreductase family protein n=1 Tax=Ruminococcus sp. TaxID=41978 RepID=UPI0025E78BA4|nr:nitroreductase family protein [Ruminococcus sp.]MBQ8967519.1 nitroreductase family protein [Ruminococcus sp.]